MGTALPPGPVSNSRLDSWKQIASYLKRDIRTVQLWEKNEGLPIYRHAHGTRASVYAYTDEIDAWQKNRQPQIHSELTLPRQPRAGPSQVPQAPASIWKKVGILAGVGVAALLALLWMRIASRSPIQPESRASAHPATLAVLPFEDLSPGATEGYVADGLTDDLITNLGRSNGLQVISRTSVMRFKGKHEPLPQIAQALQANLILEGTITYSGKRARITAQLIDAATDRHLWANSYERNFDDVIAWQDEIAEEVASAIIPDVTRANATNDGNPVARSTDPETRIAYLKGRFFWNKRDDPGLKEAIRYFDEAISKDPNYAPAYAGLADCYNLLSVWGSLSPPEAFPKAKEAALKALQLDPASAEAYTSLAFETYRFDWNFSGAEGYFQKAVRLNSNYATAHQWYGEFLSDMTRHDQGIAELAKAKKLDPLSSIVGSDLAVAYIYASRTPEAIRELEQILIMDPSFLPAHSYLASAYAYSGRPAKALEEAETYSRFSGNEDWLEILRISQAWSSGKEREAHQRLKVLLRNSKEGRFGYVQLADAYMSVDDKDEALECLEKAYRKHSWWLVTLLVDPSLAPLRNDPRFHDLVRRVGLPQNRAME
jgi:TolB-like protein